MTGLGRLMDEAWFTEVADELARCLVDAERCADECERLLESAGADGSPVRQRVADAVVVPAAVARVLLDLLDQSRPVAAAAATLCRDTALEAAAALERLDADLDVHAAVSALRDCAESCGLLLDA